MNILFAQPATAQNRTGATAWKTLTMQPNWSANMKKALLNKGLDFFFVKGKIVKVLPLLPLYFHFSLYYLHVINPNRASVIIWLYLISFSSYVIYGKHRCRLFGWPAELVLLVDQVYTSKTPFQRYSGVDYLDKMIFTFNKSFILPPTKLSPWQPCPELKKNKK